MGIKRDHVSKVICTAYTALNTARFIAVSMSNCFFGGINSQDWTYMLTYIQDYLLTIEVCEHVTLFPSKSHLCFWPKPEAESKALWAEWKGQSSSVNSQDPLGRGRGRAIWMACWVTSKGETLDWSHWIMYVARLFRILGHRRMYPRLGLSQQH